MFDDYGSIGALADYGGVRDWRTFKAFVFGGHAGPTGRPLSLLSFLIDANNWPTDPWPFKRTNLIIHLVNGALLGLLAGKVLRVLEFDKHSARWIALISTACWLLHPFLVSTTLYAVQRMAQLSTLFMFAGLAAYLHGRVLVTTNTVRAYSIMTLSLGFFTFLANQSRKAYVFCLGHSAGVGYFQRRVAQIKKRIGEFRVRFGQTCITTHRFMRQTTQKLVNRESD